MAPWTPPAEPESTAQVDQADGSPALQAWFRGVGGWHRRLFLDAERVAALVPSLRACTGETPGLWVTYDPTRRLGRIVATFDATAATCAPSMADGSLDLAPLVSLGAALAAYRADLAAHGDLRIAGFDIGVHVGDSDGGATWWAQGQYPTDGSTWAPCAVLDGAHVCGAGDPDSGVVQVSGWSPTVASRLGALLSQAPATGETQGSP